MKDLTVIIPVYNAALLIDRCLDSVFSQQGEYQIEVICVDDGSTDDSVERIKQRREPSIRLITQQNNGPASARNKGIFAAEGHCIAFLDADDYWMPNFVERTLGFLHTHRECIAVSVGQRHITMSGESVKPDGIEDFDGLMELDDFSSSGQDTTMCAPAVSSFVRRCAARLVASGRTCGYVRIWNIGHCSPHTEKWALSQRFCLSATV